MRGESSHLCHFHLAVEESHVRCLSKISTKEEYLFDSLDNQPFWIKISISPLSYNSGVDIEPFDFTINLAWRIILCSISDMSSSALCFIGATPFEKISTESPFNDF